MQTIELEYNSRLNEFDELLKFLDIIENNNLYNNKEEKIYIKNNIVINSIKSSLILIIYNLIEFTIINSIESIEEDFKQYDIKFFKEEFQTLFYKSFWIFLNELKFNNILDIVTEDDANLANIIKYWYFNKSLKLNDKCKIKVLDIHWQSIWIKWNINYKIILTLSNLFNFKIWKTKYINPWELDLLHDIKWKRNALSHWSDSFNSLWQSISISQLIDYRKKVGNFLDWYIIVINNYIEDKPYLKVWSI